MDKVYDISKLPLDDQKRIKSFCEIIATGLYRAKQKELKEKQALNNKKCDLANAG